MTRRRATALEMEYRARFFVQYAREHHPVTVRQLFYAATVHDIPGITKDEAGYIKVQNQVLQLRREGRLSYAWITDGSRMMQKPQTYSSVDHALDITARTYRKALWDDSDYTVELWVEKDALSGVIYPVTSEYDVPLMVTRGYTSETFAWSAIENADPDKTFVPITLYDFDRSGQDAANSTREKLKQFGRDAGVEVSPLHLGLTYDMVLDRDLPTREPKRKTTADKNWPYDFACELDALPPNDLRALVRDAIEHFLPSGELEYLKKIEALERETLREFIGLAS